MKKVVNRFLAGTVITGIGMSSVVMNVFGADLKLNPDVMKKAKAPDAHSLYSDIVSADEIFINFENKYTGISILSRPFYIPNNSASFSS